MRTYIENTLGTTPGCLGVALGEGDELLGQALGLLGLGISGVDGLVLDERGDQVAQQSLAMRRATAQVPVFDVGAGHCVCGVLLVEEELVPGYGPRSCVSPGG